MKVAIKNHWLRLNLKGTGRQQERYRNQSRSVRGGIARNSRSRDRPAISDKIRRISPWGLGDAKEADVVRMLWPTGVLQDEVEVAADREQKYLK
jgi:hypothetical protein